MTATESGKQLAQSTPSPLQQKLGDALQQLSEQEQLQITTALERVVALIDSDNDIDTDMSVSSLLDMPVGDVPPESGLVV